MTHTAYAIGLQKLHVCAHPVLKGQSNIILQSLSRSLFLMRQVKNISFIAVAAELAKRTITSFPNNPLVSPAKFSRRESEKCFLFVVL